MIHAELTARIRALEISIAWVASESTPRPSIFSRSAGWDQSPRSISCSRSRTPNALGEPEILEAFVGLCPKRDQSGETDKELRISKCGDHYLHRLLVSAAEHILGSFGTEKCVARLRTTARQDGTAKAKKRAVVAVARSSLFAADALEIPSTLRTFSYNGYHGGPGRVDCLSCVEIALRVLDFRVHSCDFALQRNTCFWLRTRGKRRGGPKAIFPIEFGF